MQETKFPLTQIHKQLDNVGVEVSNLEPTLVHAILEEERLERVSFCAISKSASARC